MDYSGIKRFNPKFMFNIPRQAFQDEWDAIIWLGDYNYRSIIKGNEGGPAAQNINLMCENQWSELLSNDQLIQ